jgi:hypothetical protein
MRDKNIAKALSLIYKLFRAIRDSKTQSEFNAMADGPLQELKKEIDATGYGDTD